MYLRLSVYLTILPLTVSDARSLPLSASESVPRSWYLTYLTESSARKKEARRAKRHTTSGWKSLRSLASRRWSLMAEAAPSIELISPGAPGGSELVLGLVVRLVSDRSIAYDTIAPAIAARQDPTRTPVAHLAISWQS